MSLVSARRTSPVENLHQNAPIRQKIRNIEGKISPKKNIIIKLQMKKGWGYIFVRHFLLLLVKIRVVFCCGRTYESQSHVGARTARTKLAPLTPELHENFHRFTPAGHLLAVTIYCQKCQFTVWAAANLRLVLTFLPECSTWSIL